MCPVQSNLIHLLLSFDIPSIVLIFKSILQLVSFFPIHAFLIVGLHGLRNVIGRWQSFTVIFPMLHLFDLSFLLKLFFFFCIVKVPIHCIVIMSFPILFVNVILSYLFLLLHLFLIVLIKLSRYDVELLFGVLNQRFFSFNG
jgi:hypothetical protein